MEDYVYRDGCRRQPNKECDLCEICFEEVYGQDYEPTDAEIEYEIEKQIAEAEAKADNL